MSRNGSGTYVAPSSSWNPAVNGVTATFADWNALLTDIAAALTQSVSKDGQTTMTGNLPMGGFVLTGLGAGAATGQSVRWQQLFSQGVQVDIASASTVDIGAENTNFLNITGTTTITSFGTNYNGPRFLRFDGALTLTHNATTLILPGGANITTAAGDTCIAIPNSSTSGTADGWLILGYQRGDGGATFVGPVKLNGGTTLGDASGDALLINSTTATLGGSALAFSAPLRLANGSAAAPSLCFTNSTTTGFYREGADSIGIAIAGTQLGEITSEGLLLGTGTSFATNGRGQFEGNASNAPLATRQATASNVGQVVFYNSNGLVGSISTSGTATAYNTSSDARLKTEPIPLDAGEMLDKLVMYRFKWKADGRIGYGGYAQEMHQVLPDMVTPGNDKEPGDKEFIPWGVDYSVAVPFLIAEIQSLRRRVAALEAK